MKIAVECKSPLLQKSLEIFLVNYLSSTKQSDIVIRDEECLEDERCFYISSSSNSDLKKPFSKAQLVFALDARYKSMNENISDNTMGFEILEKRIESLTKEYQENILRTVKAFYEK